MSGLTGGPQRAEGAGAPAPPRFEARHVEHSGTVRVERPLTEAFPFFTPEGERAWAPGWDPEYLHPSSGALSPGLTFRTRAGGEETLWYVARVDTARGEAEYVRMTPGSRLGTVSIRCEGAAAGATLVHVTYRLTATSAHGNDVLAAFDDAAFESMMQEWQRAIAGLTAAP